MPIDVYPTPDWGPNHSDNPDFTPYEEEEDEEAVEDDEDDDL